MNKQKIIVIDVETTGVNPKDSEALQISIIDGEAKCLFNAYIKPIHATSWEGAERVNGISPAMVANEPSITQYKPILDAIIEDAELIVGYNSDNFDLPLLRNLGINISETIPTFDVMMAFSPIYGEWNDYRQDYKWQKLTTCANYYGYGDFVAHDSLEDCKATLHCYYKMTERVNV